MEPINLNEHRCSSCGKLFFKGDLQNCTIEIKCRRCGEIKLISFENGNRIEMGDSDIGQKNVSTS